MVLGLPRSEQQTPAYEARVLSIRKRLSEACVKKEVSLRINNGRHFVDLHPQRPDFFKPFATWRGSFTFLPLHTIK
jgi:hypothetical protein